MWEDIYKVTKLLYEKAPSARQLVEDKTGIVIPGMEAEPKNQGN